MNLLYLILHAAQLTEKCFTTSDETCGYHFTFMAISFTGLYLSPSSLISVSIVSLHLWQIIVARINHFF